MILDIVMSPYIACTVRNFLLIVVVAWGLVLAHSTAEGQQLRGQLSGWNNLQNMDDDEINLNIGVRYLPEFTYGLMSQSPYTMDVELSANTYGSYNSDREEMTRDLKPYRLWARFATHQFESRIGLQKINFGPAKLLRSLMWFDRLDPRDPLQLTDGVYGLRLRYDFENLSSIWLWGLYGAGETKGLEFAPTRDRSLEYGGRLNYPLGPGEVGLTTHHRTVDPSLQPVLALTGTHIPESRIALDGIWDVGVGVWFESALIHADYSSAALDWQSFQTVGMDYTLPFGNGLYLLGEHMLFTMSDVPFDLNERVQTSGVMASYPIGWLDQVALYSIYNWDANLAYHYLSWQRTYDQWVIYLGAYAITGEGEFPSFAGREMGELGEHGMQIMVIFNH
ncbi:MAG TPA: hypothetical protein VKA68_17190 [bacterium]|nr:hypothetical protein [bacterium]